MTSHDRPGSDTTGHQYRVLAHTADTGIEAWGATREEMLANIAAGMVSLMYRPRPARTADRRVAFTVAAGSDEDMVMDVLSEVLFLGEVEELVFSRFEVTATGDGRSRVVAIGGPATEETLVGPPIKAVTYHGLSVDRNDEWRTTVIFDV